MSEDDWRSDPKSETRDANSDSVLQSSKGEFCCARFHPVLPPTRLRERSNGSSDMNLESAWARLNAEFYGPGDCDARDYLWERGFYLDAECRWHAPHGLTITAKDSRALAFLAVVSGFDPNVIKDGEQVPPPHRQH